MQVRKIILPVLIVLFTAPAAFCQSEMLKSVVNNLAFYKQKKDLKYLSSAKKSVDSLITTHADSLDVEKNVYKGFFPGGLSFFRIDCRTLRFNSCPVKFQRCIHLL